MKRIYLFLSFLSAFLVPCAWARNCHIASFRQIYVFKRPVSNAIAETNCSKQISDRFLQLVSSRSGTLEASHLAKLLGEQGHTVSIAPNKIDVTEINDFLEKSLQLPSALKVAGTHDQLQKSAYVLLGETPPEVGCKDCTVPGEHWAYFRQKESSDRQWFKLELKKLVSVYRATRDLDAFNRGLSPKTFELAYVAQDKLQGNPVSDLKIISYFQTNKKIKRGEALYESSLSPLPLVKAGETVNILLRGESIRLKTKMKSAQQGYFGESIRCRNEKTGKTIQAIVTGPETAEVRL